MKHKHKYLIKNTLIFTISSFATKVLSFLFIPLYTSILTTSEYGIAELVTTTSTVLVYVFTLNISEAVVRFVIDDKEDALNIYSFAIRIVVYGAIVCGFFIFLLNVFSVLSLPDYCYVYLFVIYFVSGINALVTSYSRGVDQIIRVAIAGVVSSAMLIASNLLFLLGFDMRLKGYMLAIIVANIGSIAYLVLSLRLPVYGIITKNFDKDKKKRMLKYSIPLIFNSVAWWINGAFDRYIISFIEGVAQNGLYGAASKIPLIIATINSIFGQAWGLSAIRDIDDNDEDGFFSVTYNTYNCILVIIGSVIIWLNVPITKILFAKAYFDAWQFSSILIISTIFNALSSFLGGVFTKVMKTEVHARTTVLSAVLNIVLNIWFISMWGTIGAAIATAVSFLVMWATRFIAAHKYVKMNIPYARHFISYAILTLQVIIEHKMGGYTHIQLILVLCLSILYKKEISSLISIFLVSIFKVKKEG